MDTKALLASKTVWFILGAFAFMIAGFLGFRFTMLIGCSACLALAVWGRATVTKFIGGIFTS